MCERAIRSRSRLIDPDFIALTGVKRPMHQKHAAIWLPHQSNGGLAKMR
jgi:hypothetical protein